MFLSEAYFKLSKKIPYQKGIILKAWQHSNNVKITAIIFMFVYPFCHACYHPCFLMY